MASTWSVGRRRAAVAAMLAVSIGLVSACTADPPATPDPTTSTVGAPDPSTTPPPGPSSLVLAPAKSTNVAPGDPVRVQLVNGTLDAVSLTGPGGKPVPGGFDQAKSVWEASAVLAYGASYTLTASGVGVDGQHHNQTKTFTTAKANGYASASFSANPSMQLDGGTFGVGQPIIVRFTSTVRDKAAAERSLIVTTDPPVNGVWHWFGGTEAHWRPREYWPAHTKVTVEAKIQGRSLGGGIFGRKNTKASFSIGASKIAIADSKTHHMKVYIDGVQVTKINGKDVTTGIPISMGKDQREYTASGLVDFRTASGPHVVMQKYEVYRMTSASFGITDPSSPNFYDERIRKSIRISGAGEFVHLADWNIPKHGHENTSHGCINVAPTYIYWFYDTFGAGDVVDVLNTGRKLDVRDGLGDWTLTWAQWTAGSATYA